MGSPLQDPGNAEEFTGMNCAGHIDARTILFN